MASCELGLPEPGSASASSLAPLSIARLVAGWKAAELLGSYAKLPATLMHSMHSLHAALRFKAWDARERNSRALEALSSKRAWFCLRRRKNFIVRGRRAALQLQQH